MNKLKIALLQIAPCGSLSANLAKGEHACREAAQKGADIALFPEMWSCSYDIYDRPPEVWKRDAISTDSSFVNVFGELARELHMAIGITFLEEYGSTPRNTLVLFDRHGERRLTYSKVHTCDFGVERELAAGDDFYVSTLDTAAERFKSAQ